MKISKHKIDRLKALFTLKAQNFLNHQNLTHQFILEYLSLNIVDITSESGIYLGNRQFSTNCAVLELLENTLFITISELENHGIIMDCQLKELVNKSKIEYFWQLILLKKHTALNTQQKEMFLAIEKIFGIKFKD